MIHYVLFTWFVKCHAMRDSLWNGSPGFSSCIIQFFSESPCFKWLWELLRFLSILSHMSMTFLATFLSMSDPVDLTSLISIQMPVVFRAVILGNFHCNFLQHSAHSTRTTFHIQFMQKSTLFNSMHIGSHSCTTIILIHKY